jgi:hypothetical protein
MHTSILDAMKNNFEVMQKSINDSFEKQADQFKNLNNSLIEL